MRDIVSPLDGFLSPFGVVRGAWSPSSLFASGETGAWYEPSPTNCFQLSNGTTAAGVGDPVGYLTDLSGNGNHAVQSTAAARPTLRATYNGTGALGAELVANGTFDSDVSGWSVAGGTTSVDGDGVTLTNTTSRTTLSQSFSVTAENAYIVTAKINNLTSGANAATIRVLTTNAWSGTKIGELKTTLPGDNVLSTVVTATTGTIYLWAGNNTTTGGNTVRFDNISVREVPEASRLYYLEFDGVDDVLVTNEVLASAGSDVDFFFGVNAGTDAQYMLLNSDGVGQTSAFLGVGESGSSSTSYGLSGTPSVFVDNSSAGTTRDNLYDALTGATHILEYRGADISANWEAVRIGNWQSSGYVFAGDIYAFVARSSLSAAERSSLVTYLATKTGVTL